LLLDRPFLGGLREEKGQRLEATALSLPLFFFLSKQYAINTHGQRPNRTISKKPRRGAGAPGLPVKGPPGRARFLIGPKKLRFLPLACAA